MANVKISQLPSADTPLAGTEEVPVVQGGVTKKTTVDDIAAAAGAVTDVTATSPLSSTGGATPDISIPAANGSTSGYLTSTDWNTFNNKQPAGDYVTGPASATDNAITRFDSTTGKLVQNSGVTLNDNNELGNVNDIAFDTTPGTVPTAPGSLYWDAADNNQTLSLVMAGGNAVQQIGEEIYYRVKASAAITNGQSVMVTGAVGASGGLLAAPASGLTANNGEHLIGVATEDIALNGWGYVTQFGLVRNIDTTGASVGETWVDGDTLYYNPSYTGGLTKSVPVAPTALVEVAEVVHAHASSGSLFIRITLFPRLNQLANVYAPSPADNELIKWSSSASRWETTPIKTVNSVSLIGSGNVSTGDIVGPASATDNAVARFDGTTGKLIQNSAVTIADDGATVISTNSSSDALRITQTGAGNALVVEDSANPDATPFVINSVGAVVIGKDAPISIAGSSGSLQVLGNSGATTTIANARFSADATSPIFDFLKSRGASVGSLGVVSNNDSIGRLRWQADDGTDFNTTAAQIEAAVDGTPGPNDMPGRLVFSTTADGASTPTERMRIDSAGNVGIGATAGNDTKLRIAGTYAGGFVIRVDGTLPTAAANGVLVDTFPAFASGGTYSTYRHYRARQGSLSGSTLTEQFGFEASNSLTGATNNYGFYSNIDSGTGRWNFYANGTAANYFAGNVGIGTTTTTNKLEIGGSGDSVMRLLASGQANGLEIGQLTADGSSKIFAVNNNSISVGTNNTERLRITSTGNVGIGTSSPNYLLQLHRAAAASSALQLTNTASGSAATDGFGLFLTNALLAEVWQFENADMRFGTNNTERMRLDSSGNLGLGVTPSAWVTFNSIIQGQGYALAGFASGSNVQSALICNAFFDGSNFIYRSSAAASEYLQISGQHQWFTAPSGTAGNAISFTQAMTLDASGNLGIGTSSPAAKFHVYGADNIAKIQTSATNTSNRGMIVFYDGADDFCGQITSNPGTNTTSYNTSSDYRLKDNIQDVTGSGEFIDALQPRTWNWKSDGSIAAGFIAHELQAVSPTSVVGEKDAVDENGNPQYQSVEYGSAEVIAMLVAEVKSLRARLAAAGL